MPGKINAEMAIAPDGIVVAGDELGGDSDLFLFKIDFIRNSALDSLELDHAHVVPKGGILISV